MPTERDSVDEILEQWLAERPDLDFAPVGIVTRLARVRAHLDAEVSALFKRYGLSPADFQVIVALRRSGAPFSMPQARLMTQLSLTSGTVSVRVDRLAKTGVVVRKPDPADARVAQVRLTDKGLSLFDELAPAHLANEDRLLSALSTDDRTALAGLLRKLLASLEHPSVDAALPWGMRLEPARVARSRRTAVGLSNTPGLLVTETLPGSAAARAGIAQGDLLTAVDGQEVRDGQALAGALLTGDGSVCVSLLRGETRETVALERAVRDTITTPEKTCDRIHRRDGGQSR